MTVKMLKVQVGSVTYLVADTDKVIFLCDDGALTTNNVTFHNDGVDYQVGSGKTFTILGFMTRGGSSAGNIITVLQSDAVNTETNAVTKGIYASLYTGDYMEIPTPERPTVAASKYLNIKSAGGNNGGWWCVGIEA